MSNLHLSTLLLSNMMCVVRTNHLYNKLICCLTADLLMSLFCRCPVSLIHVSVVSVCVTSCLTGLTTDAATAATKKPIITIVKFKTLYVILWPLFHLFILFMAPPLTMLE